ncbi:UDP-2,4-diacetamido-2,4,6-trideoxy-beta-L-altropyranose hydrolase [Desertibaculum subflavum]|uniref:UDP-2,4-diacetamido-2,4, 6-trideoxy-beta-L-altropyranose hydrolase n=1 Tax=Desertibaculum subflavum TaxID=2268458 RepID=UPI000E668D30
MTSPLAVLRADGGPRIGGGHVSRCLALATALRRAGWETTLAVEEPAIPLLKGQTSDTPFVRLPDASPLALARAVEGRTDLLLVDHYGLDHEFEAACRRFADRVVALDDMPTRRHDVDLLIDYTPGRKPDEYSGLVPGRTLVLTGPRLAALKDAYAAARPGALARRRRNGPAQRLLVSLGAGDAIRTLETVLSGVAAAATDLDVDLVAGGGADLHALAQLLARFPRHYGLHVGLRDLSALAADADIGIGAAGVTAWERCTVGLPTILVQVADNQRDAIASLTMAGAGLSLGPADKLTAQSVTAAIDRLAQDDAGRRRMGEAAAGLVDGLGAVRVALLLPPPGAPVALRAACLADARMLHEWQSEPATRRFARNPGVPGFAEHVAWLNRTLDDPAHMLCIVLSNDAPVGMLRLDRSEDETGFEVSIVISERYAGKGLARAALALARRMLPFTELRATVLPGNERSHALFRAAGYRLGQDGLYRLMPGIAA